MILKISTCICIHHYLYNYTTEMQRQRKNNIKNTSNQKAAKHCHRNLKIYKFVIDN